MSHFLHFTYHLCRLLTGVCVHCNYYKSLNISSLSVLYTFPVTEDVVLMVPPFSSDRRRCSDGPTLFQWQKTLFWWSHPFPATEDVVLMVPPFSSDRRRCSDGPTLFQRQKTLCWWSHPFPMTEDVVLMVPPFSSDRRLCSDGPTLPHFCIL
jgi:predicted RNA methylase